MILSKKHGALQICFYIILILTLACNKGLALGEENDLDHKIGQMIIVGFRGLEIVDQHPIIDDIRKRHIGGVILFDYDIPSKSPTRNIKNPVQVKKLIESIKKIETSTPLFIAIDQEGGKINRLKEGLGFGSTLSAAELGRLNDLNVTRNNSDKIAKLLSALGVNLNFAPVVDLNINPKNPIIAKYERSFSRDPNNVIKHAEEFVKAHRANGIISSLKHFPGHGSATGDTHEGFVDVSNVWSNMELEPFIKMIDNNMADMVMTSHLFNKQLDPSLPATLSKMVITGILRDQLNYDGVIISDDMQMKALTSHYELSTSIQLAINAGVDILIFSNNSNSNFDQDIAGKVFLIIKKLIKDGKVSKKRIDDSYQRILKLKQTLNN
jgi:beta-N-acetylhexosaminidase